MALPLWRIEIVKQLQSEQWSNDYLTDDATMDDAQDLAQILLTWERNLHMSVVTFVYMRVSSYVPGDRTFRHINVNAQGLAVPGDYIPLFNTMRVDFSTSDSDPGRKYYRVPVGEATQTNGTFTTDIVTQVDIQILNFLVTTNALEHLVTPKGNRITGATVYPRVQIRQLHRRNKKKVTP